MQPLYLSIKNFGNHQETEFSFEDFQSALVIGIIKENERFSNGSGKSTIFNAIEYVLFNEIHSSSLDKVIRDGCDVCRIEFHFKASLDKSTYKLIRSNSRKTGTDVRLFKLNQGNWEDMTQRRASDTEKELVKILGFNYKAFCASVLFNQALSDNSTQRDFSNLPALTPEKRKSVLREVLQLNVYGNYEKLAKTKSANIQSILEKQKIILGTLGEPEKDIAALITQYDTLLREKESLDEQVNHLNNRHASHSDQHKALSTKLKNSFQELILAREKHKTLSTDLQKIDISANDTRQKLVELTEQASKIALDKKSNEEQLTLLRKETQDIHTIKGNIEETLTAISKTRASIASIESKIEGLNKPMTDEANCSRCHQNISIDHREHWQQKTKAEIALLQEEKAKFVAASTTLLGHKSAHEKSLASAQETNAKIYHAENLLGFFEKELVSKRNLYRQYAALSDEYALSKKQISDALAQIEGKVQELSLIDGNNQEDKLRMEELRRGLNDLNQELTKLNGTGNRLISDLAVNQHKTQVAQEHQREIGKITAHIIELEKSLLLHSKVIQAFGSDGIPALIIHSILDELQLEANQWLGKLRQGLQLQFLVANDKKETKDTLDILYFIDGNEREYRQLSGAEKIIVSLSIKLAMIFIMNKRLGVDIKLMLLDEVDQAIDEGGTEIFADIIRKISEELKVLVITHNKDLRHKFSHAILMERDDNNASKGRLIHW